MYPSDVLTSPMNPFNHLSMPSLITRTSALLLCTLTLSLFSASAQQLENANQNTTDKVVETVLAPVIRPVISGRTEVEMGKRFILDASRSTIPQDAKAVYTWDFGDGTKENGVEAVHLYDKPGKYTVKLSVVVDGQTYTSETIIFAYKQIVTFFYNGDRTILDNNLPTLTDLAEKYGTYLHVIASREGNPLLTEDAISEELAGQTDVIAQSAVIVGGPSGTSFLSALTKISMQAGKGLVDLSEKTIVVTTKDSLWLSQRISTRMLGRLSPKELVVVSRDPFSTLSFLISSDAPQNLVTKFPQDEYVKLTKEAAGEWPIMALSWLVSAGIANGIPGQILVFILFMPFLLTIIGFIKQLIGVETVGLFQTMVLVLCFYIVGGTLATISMVVAVVVGVLMRFILARLNILFLSKMTLLLSASTLAVFVGVVVGSFFGLSYGIDTSTSQRAVLTIVPILLIALQADKLSILVYNKENPKEYLRLFATYFAVIISYFIIRNDQMELLLLALPELVLLPFVIQYLLGRYTGLRVVEYMRFRELFRHDVEE